MAHFIEPYRPPQPPQGKGVLAIYKPIAPIISAMGVGAELHARVTAIDEHFHGGFTWFKHDASMTRHVQGDRNKLVRYFYAADQAHRALSHEGYCSVSRKMAVTMISAMLGALGAKGDKAALAGMIDLIEGDETARASGLWLPLQATPATLALACRMLIATQKFVPKPAELGQACREARTKVLSAASFCDELVDYIRRCDAVLLEFAPEQWREPYRLPPYQPTVQCMLEYHERDGNGDVDFTTDSGDIEDFGEKEINRNFRLALARARQEFPKAD